MFKVLKKNKDIRNLEAELDKYKRALKYVCADLAMTKNLCVLNKVDWYGEIPGANYTWERIQENALEKVERFK